MKKTILILGDEADPHIEEVCSYIDNSLYRIIVLNPFSDEPCFTSISYQPLNIVFHYDNEVYQSKDICSIWWRLKPFNSKDIDDIVKLERVNFLTREWIHFLEGISEILSDIKSVNKRSIDNRLKSKPLQLLLATNAGFKIPKTIVSNTPVDLQSLLNQNSDTIYKPLTYFASFKQDKILYSTLITNINTELYKKQIRISPGIYQSYIDKHYELRITIIGNQIFSAKIFSRENDNSKIDWRKGQETIKYSEIEIEKEFELKLLGFHKNLNIVFGAYDFIYSTDNEYVFLEVNTLGQWLFLGKETSKKISKQISFELMT